METTYFDENNNPIKDIYLNKPQLCDLLGETYNTIRHWCNQFGKYLDADMSERNVKFNSADVELFKTIQLLLREENYTIKQVQVYLDENAENIKHGKMLNVDVSSNQLINKDMENLIREEVRNTVKESMNEFLSVMQQQLIQYVVQQQNTLQLQQENLLEQQTEKIICQVETTISNKLTMAQNELKNNLNDITSKLDKIELETTQKENQTITDLKNKLSERENKVKELEIENQKSWWQKLFKK